MEMTSQAALGQAVLAARKNKGWTQTDLAEKAGLSRFSLVTLEQGKSNPSWDTVLRLVNVLGMNLQLTVEDPANLGEDKPSKKRSPRAEITKAPKNLKPTSHATHGQTRLEVTGKAQAGLEDANGNPKLDDVLSKYHV